MRRILIIAVLGLLFGCNVDNNTIGFIESQRLQNQQIFEFLGNKDTVLLGDKGTILFLPKNIKYDIKPTDTITVILNEFYKKSDMILAGLNTTSDSLILASNGMIYLNLYINSNKIEKIEKPISIRFANMSDYEDYQIFNGQMIDEKMDWKPDTLTSNYRIIYNNKLKLSQFFQISSNNNYNIPIGEIMIDSTLWNNNFTKVDSIITFSTGEQLDTVFYGDIKVEAGKTYRNDLTVFLNSQNIDWINLDKFLYFDNLTTLTISSNKNSEVIYFCVFEEYKSIISLYENINQISLPVGEKVSIIGFSKEKQKFLFDIKSDFTINRNMNIKLNLKDTDLDAIKTQLEKLN